MGTVLAVAGMVAAALTPTAWEVVQVENGKILPARYCGGGGISGGGRLGRNVGDRLGMLAVMDSDMLAVMDSDRVVAIDSDRVAIDSGVVVVPMTWI
jgi:hypothetical protein